MADSLEAYLGGVSFGVIDHAGYDSIQSLAIGEEELLVTLEAVDVPIVIAEQRGTRNSNLVDVTARVTSNEDRKAALIAAALTLTTGTRTFYVIGACSAGVGLLVLGTGFRHHTIVGPAVRQRCLCVLVVRSRVELAARFSQPVNDDDIQLVRDCLADLLPAYDALKYATIAKLDTAHAASARGSHTIHTTRLAAHSGQVGWFFENGDIAHGSYFSLGLRTWITYLLSTCRPMGRASGFSSKNCFMLPLWMRFSSRCRASCLTINSFIFSQSVVQ